MKPVLRIYSCEACEFRFTKEDAQRSCSNCFACTGCEIYLCPNCGKEVVIKPIKPMLKGNNPNSNH